MKPHLGKKKQQNILNKNKVRSFVQLWMRSPSVPCPSFLCTWKGHVSFSFKDLLSTCSERGGTHKPLEPKKPCGLGQSLALLGNEEHPCVKSRESLDCSAGWMLWTVSPLVGKWACWCILQWSVAFQVWSPSAISAEPQPHISFFPRQVLLWFSTHHSTPCHPQLTVAFIAHRKASFCSRWRLSGRSTNGQHEENKM